VKLLVLATEGLSERDLWYPTILGVITVIAAVSLFCGSIYLLLATDLGARLGFLVAAAGLTGFMVLLSLLWITTSSPLNTLRGRQPSWKAVESIEGGDLARSKIPAVREVKNEGELDDAAEQANIKAAVDTTVVTPAENPGSQEVAATNKFAVYASAEDYLVTKYFVTGGGNVFSQVDVDVNGEFPLVHVSLHEPKYAVVLICPADKEAQVVPFGEPPPEPKCDASKSTDALVFELDLGSVRVPPIVALLGSSILFGLCLLGLHWRERDLQEQAAALQAEADRATRAAIEKAPEEKVEEPV
jgi:hypothetical protein